MCVCEGGRGEAVEGRPVKKLPPVCRWKASQNQGGRGMRRETGEHSACNGSLVLALSNDCLGRHYTCFTEKEAEHRWLISCTDHFPQD